MIRWPENALLPSSAIKAAASGDMAALDLILRSFRPLVRHVLQRVPVEYREDAEDEIYLGLLMSLTSFEPFVLDNGRMAVYTGSQSPSAGQRNAGYASAGRVGEHLRL